MTRSALPVRTTLRALARSRRGSMAIETAIVAPVLALLAVGIFDVSRMVARQSELQNGAAEAEAIALAAGAGAQTDIQTLASILQDSLSLAENEVAVDKLYRCNADATLVESASLCGEDDVVSTYVRLDLRDTFTPIWTRMGATGAVQYRVERTVQLS